MSSNEEEKQQVIAYRLEKAKKTLEDAKKVIELELWATAANRLYYAAYYAVSSLLLFHGLNAKTHEGIIRMFNMHFVKTGRIDTEQGRQYNSFLPCVSQGIMAIVLICKKQTSSLCWNRQNDLSKQ